MLFPMIDLFKDLGLPEKKLHQKFVLLAKPILAAERKILESWAEGFIDRDHKIVKEFQTSFHSAFWELYLHRLFHDLGFTLDYSRERPDFTITAPQKFYVEAVVANIKESGRKEITRNLDDILNNLTPLFLQRDFEDQMTEAIIRYSNAIQAKVAKLKRGYLGLSWVDSNAPFVIAMASYSQINYGREYYYPMFALLYGMFYDPITQDYFPKAQIHKPGSNAPIKVSLFDDPAMQDVSAIIFSCTVTIGKLTSMSKSLGNPSTQTVLIIREEIEFPHYMLQDVSEESKELHSDGLFVFHNPNARIKLSPDTFAGCCALQISLDEEGVLQFEGKREPMLIRLNIPSMWLPPTVKRRVIEGTFQAFNNIRLPGY